MTASNVEQHLAAADMLLPMMHTVWALAARANAAEDAFYAAAGDDAVPPEALRVARAQINELGPQADSKLKVLEEALGNDDPFHATTDFARLYPLESDAFRMKWQDGLAEIASFVVSITDAVCVWEEYVKAMPEAPTT